MPTLSPTILIVRPPLQAKDDAITCQQLGWQAIPFSPIVIEADHEALEHLNQQIQYTDIIFWVSPNAIRLAAPYIHFNHHTIQHITVGEGSKAVLAQYYPDPIIYPTDGNDSEAVLRLFTQNNFIKGNRILIIRGHHGRDFLLQQLTKLQFQVTTAEIYFRRPNLLDWHIVEEAKPQVIYITSSEMVRELFRQAPLYLTQWLQSLLYLTHHQRIVDTLRTFGVKQIKIVARLDAHALHYCIKGVNHE